MRWIRQQFFCRYLSSRRQDFVYLGVEEVIDVGRVDTVSRRMPSRLTRGVYTRIPEVECSVHVESLGDSGISTEPAFLDAEVQIDTTYLK